jgi:hypothetical protein
MEPRDDGLKAAAEIIRQDLEAGVDTYVNVDKVLESREMRTALLATTASLAVLAGCKSQPLAIKLQPAVSSALSPTRVDLDALEQDKQAAISIRVILDRER